MDASISKKAPFIAPATHHCDNRGFLCEDGVCTYIKRARCRHYPTCKAMKENRGPANEKRNRSRSVLTAGTDGYDL